MPLTPSVPTSAVRVATSRPTVVVVGDAVLDTWWSGEVHRIAREAPVPVITVGTAWDAPGGAANTAANLAALGARVRLVSTVGDDEAGRRLLDALRERGIDVRGVRCSPTVRTVTKRRVLVGGHVVMRLDDGVDDGTDSPVAVATPTRYGGAGPDVAPATTARYGAANAAALRSAAGDADVLVVADYGLGLAASPVKDVVARLRRRMPVVVDAHDVRPWRGVRPTVVTPSAQEASRATGRPLSGPRRAEAVVALTDDLVRASGAAMVAVTLDRDGSVLLRPGSPPHRTTASPAPEERACGAGDAFVAGFAAGLAAGLDLVDCADLAQACAQVVVRDVGTSVCRAEDLAVVDLREHDDEEVLGRIERARDAGARVVFTNGCFDVLHAGHVSYLAEARACGDVLVVALNSDGSVRRLKGPDRPVNHERDRAAVLRGLCSVDHVVLFDDDSPTRLLRRLRPHVYVKGGDYTPEMLPEAPVVAEYGGEIRILGYLDGRSTTTIVHRLSQVQSERR